MQPDEELNPQENAPVGEPAPVYPENEPVPAESAELTPEQPAGEPAVEETFTETVQEKPAAARLPRLQVGQPHPKKTFGSRVLPWVIVALLFYVGGLATIYFALHQPKVEALQTDAAEQATLAKAAAENNAARIINLTDDYNQALKQYQTAQAALDLTKGELEAARSTIAEQEAGLTRLTKSNIAYKFLMHVSTARTALEQQDTATARQAVNLAKTDLEELKQTDVTADILAGFAEKLNEASSNLTLTGIDRARAALDSLYTNLLLLIENMP
jgi:cell division protein FtsB